MLDLVAGRIALPAPAPPAKYISGPASDLSDTDSTCRSGIRNPGAPAEGVLTIRPSFPIEQAGLFIRWSAVACQNSKAVNPTIAPRADFPGLAFQEFSQIICSVYTLAAIYQ
jgi:hypothetical protein